MPEQNWGKASFVVDAPDGTTTYISVCGRERWALECLMAANAKGCTPIDHPGPRWSAYVFDLRGMGLDIETAHERHTGPFPGSHARYVLRSKVRRIVPGGEA
ncbi:hypothetical protein L0V05_15790 [Tabrizicola sp. J26]|uniref:winged helix domain-containing protein n=1 Tax=Alitabrizicola rongguiensis TaxID=2909234 RepID=UPI001F414796|nr:hypothetical protein [Tabrizicola rongguiensis]MCF1710275.1 hypothetical protein [Tabrizicola rongguiensis]